jgi:tRNA pseudouridine55 synthase
MPVRWTPWPQACLFCVRVNLPSASTITWRRKKSIPAPLPSALPHPRTTWKDYSHVTPELLQSIAQQFTGEIAQVPPMHSAIKKDGVRVYELARKGITIELEPRRITIKEFEITSIELPVVHFRVVCTTGTYIRSLANDVGQAAGCGAYLSKLCRTRIGEFTLDQSMTMEAAEAWIKKEKEAELNKQ